MKIALFSSIIPDMIPLLFGGRFLKTAGWEIDHFTTDHGLSGTFLDSCRPLYHYFAFPHLHEQKHYDLMVYIIHRDIDAHILTDFMDYWPGIVILETMDIHRERFRFFRESGRFHRYLAEMALIHGQRGLEIARILLREGEQHRLIRQFSLLPAILDGSLAVVVPDRRYWMEVRRLYPHKPVINVLPARQAVSEMQHREQSTESKTFHLKDVRDSSLVRCTVLHETKDSLWHATVYSTLARLCRQQDLSVQIKTISVNRGHKRRAGKEFRLLLNLIDRTVRQIDLSDLLINENLEASFLDDLFTIYALHRGIPVIASASNHSADNLFNGLLPVYPGYHETSQVNEWLEWLFQQNLTGYAIVEMSAQPELNEELSRKEFRRLISLFEAIVNRKYFGNNVLGNYQEQPLLSSIDPHYQERESKIDDDVRAMIIRNSDNPRYPEESAWLYSTIREAIKSGPITSTHC